ncbi:MAG TPA: DUF1385 domain-containing protein [Acidaminococcaceae bacterium]|nr:DUF1385 domain-containing protein [Acidaminococcaceae bacterium]
MAQNKEENQSCAFRTSIGGQALIEGILMRGPEKEAIVVRDQEGKLVEKVEPLKFVRDRYPILGVPLIRGTVNFLDSMVHGVKALMYSADFYPDEEAAQPSKFEQWLEKHLSSKKLESAIVTLAVVLGVGLSIFLFMVLPTFLTGGLLHFFPDFPLWGRNLLEGLLRIAIFLLYLIFCSKQKDIYRVFQYHGAEHKTIFAYEAGLPLTVENVRKFPRLHPRCGTNFLMIVMCISIFVFAFLGWPNLLERILSRILLMPVVAGVSYEIIRFAGRHNDNPWIHKLILPGLLLQKLTTREPADEMIEVAIASVKAVVPVDGKAVVSLQVPDSIALKAPVQAAEAAAEHPDAAPAETGEEAAEGPSRE